MGNMFLIRHAFLEGTKNLWRSFWLSITAIFVITVSLSSVALVASLWVTAGFTLRQFDNQAVLYVYLKDDIAQEDIDVMKKDLEGLSQAKSVEFIDKQAAQNEVANSPSISEAARNLVQIAGDENKLFLPQSFKITPNSSENYEAIETFVRQEKYSGIISELQGTKDFIARLRTFYYWTGLIGAILVFIFGMLSILVMANMLRIAIYNRRDEIEIMRLVGATNNYIRGPYIAEGMMYNLVAALFVCLVFFPLFNSLIPQLQTWLGVQISSSSDLVLRMYLSIAVTIVVGILVGAATSYFATQKYLKL